VLVDLESDDYREVSTSFEHLLSFYGGELQSHAAVILGVMVVTFAIVQAWGGLPERLRSDGFHGFWFAVVVGVVGAGMVYQLWRLYAFGKLTSGIMYCSDNAWKMTREKWNKDVKEEKTRIGIDEWERLFDMTKAVIYAEAHLKESSKRFVNLGTLGLTRTSDRVRLRHRVLVAAFLLAFFVSYVLLFGELGAASIVYVILLASLIRVGYAARRRLFSVGMKLLDVVS